MDLTRIPTLSTEEISYYEQEYTIQFSHEQLQTYVNMLLNGLDIQFEYPRVVVVCQVNTLHSKNILPLGEVIFACKHGMYTLPLDGKYHRYNYLMEKFTGLYSPADACELASVIHQLGKAWQERIVLRQEN